MNLKELVSARVAAEKIGISPSTLRGLVARGRVKVHRSGISERHNRLLFEPGEVERLRVAYLRMGKDG